MALWNTFLWSDGTKWADARGTTGGYTAFIDRSAYRVSLRLTQNETIPPGSLAALVIKSVSAETGPRPQLPNDFEAFIDRNETTQRISVSITHTGNPEGELRLETDDPILLENGDNLFLDPAQPFQIDKIHMIVNPRSRRQPTA